MVHFYRYLFKYVFMFIKIGIRGIIIDWINDIKTQLIEDKNNPLILRKL